MLALLVLIAASASLLLLPRTDDGLLGLPEFRVGAPSPRTVRSARAFTVEDPTSTESRRRLAAEAVPQTYRYQRWVSAETTKRLQAAFQAVEQSMERAPDETPEVRARDFMLALGVPVCLGTDSLASNPDLSILGEMREVAQRHPQVAPETILHMATQAGAQALGLSDVGAIRPGAHADLVAVPLPQGAKGLPSRVLAHVLYDEEVSVDSVWLSGERVESVAV